MKFLNKYRPIFLLFAIWIFITYPFWFKGLIPAPLDFLVNFYNPWGGLNNFPVKNPAIADVVNQIIPWKLFTVSQLKQAVLPLWNPYNLAGSPHLANWQSAVFYPLNILFFLLSFLKAWGIYILIQPLLASLFTYLYCQTLKLSKPASVLAAISFSFSGFLTTWLEWGTLGHAILWLPLSLWCIEKYINSRHLKFLILNSLVLSLSLLAGHLQISLYVFIFSIIYFLKRSNFKNWRHLLFWFLPFILTAFQIVPSLELYLRSLRFGSHSPDWYKFFQIPIQHLVTFIAPDFFGAPATRNLWGKGSYVEMMGYIGLIPLIFAFSTLKLINKHKLIKFFWIIIAAFLVLALKNPISNFVLWLRLPVFSSSSPARIIGLISFSLAVLAGIGFDKAKKHHLKTSLKLLIFLSFLWVTTFIFVPTEYILVARRNLIFPSVIIFSAIGLFFLSSKKKSLLPTFYSLLLLVSLVELFRFHHKFTPYSDKKHFYPSIPMIEQLAKLPQPNHTFGLFDANLNLPFNLFSLQGYDPFIFKRYPELISTHKDGLINLQSRTSEVDFGINQNYSMTLLNLLNAKYFIQQTVHGAASWELNLWLYPDQFEIIYDDSYYQILENKKALEYFFVTTDYKIASSDSEIISLLLDPKNTSLILEKEPPINIQDTDQSPGDMNLLSFKPNKLEFNLTLNQPALVYINSNYYPGWQAFVDGQKTQIMRANYSFKAIPVPKGDHKLTLVYKSYSFTIGLVISSICSLGLILYLFKKHET